MACSPPPPSSSAASPPCVQVKRAAAAEPWELPALCCRHGESRSICWEAPLLLSLHSCPSATGFTHWEFSQCLGKEFHCPYTHSKRSRLSYMGPTSNSSNSSNRAFKNKQKIPKLWCEVWWKFMAPFLLPLPDWARGQRSGLKCSFNDKPKALRSISLSPPAQVSHPFVLPRLLVTS